VFRHQGGEICSVTGQTRHLSAVPWEHEATHIRRRARRCGRKDVPWRPSIANSGHAASGAGVNHDGNSHVLGAVDERGNDFAGAPARLPLVRAPSPLRPCHAGRSGGWAFQKCGREPRLARLRLHRRRRHPPRGAFLRSAQSGRGARAPLPVVFMIVNNGWGDLGSAGRADRDAKRWRQKAVGGRHSRSTGRRQTTCSPFREGW